MRTVNERAVQRGRLMHPSVSLGLKGKQQHLASSIVCMDLIDA